MFHGERYAEGSDRWSAMASGGTQTSEAGNEQNHDLSLGFVLAGCYPRGGRVARWVAGLGQRRVWGCKARAMQGKIQISKLLD